MHYSGMVLQVLQVLCLSCFCFLMHFVVLTHVTGGELVTCHSIDAFVSCCVKLLMFTLRVCQFLCFMCLSVGYKWSWHA